MTTSIITITLAILIAYCIIAYIIAIGIIIKIIKSENGLNSFASFMATLIMYIIMPILLLTWIGDNISSDE